VNFARPELLWLALLGLFEVLLGLRRIPRHRESLEKIAGPRRRGRAGRLFAGFSWSSCISAALFFAVAARAAAGPSWGSRGVRAERQGLEAAIVLDVSRSMEATDAQPTRLDAAKRIIGSLLHGPEAGQGAKGTSFSLIAAKGGAVLLAPMTEDEIAFEDALVYATPEVTTVPGTDLESGIRLGLSSFTRLGVQGRVLLLFSDGGELTGSARSACQAAISAGARLLVVGVGGRKPVPVPGPEGSALVGPHGPIRSALDRERLRFLAAAGRGRYLEASDPGLVAALNLELSKARGSGTRIEYQPVERRGLFAFLALILLCASILSSLLATRGARA
jgi:Ca-activated chloride channel family protein